MTAKRAKTLTAEQFATVLNRVEERRDCPALDTLILRLSFNAGLRACEMAGLDWDDVLDALGEIRQDFIDVPGDIAKNGRRRTVPLHPALYQALKAWYAALPEAARARSEPVLRAPRAGRFSRNTLQRYISRLFIVLDVAGCTSHSGRRTFITQMARSANAFGCSLKDVQMLAGHAHISTTEIYVDPSDSAAAMVGAL